MIKLNVAEANLDDVGKFTVRISPVAMEELEVSPGDYVNIKGQKQTTCIVRRSLPDDDNLPIIRMDGSTRSNAKAQIENKVDIEKSIPKPAKNITISQLMDEHKQIVTFGEDPSKFLTPRLQKVPFTKGDTFTLDIMGKQFRFIVTSTSPKSPVIVTDNTAFKVSDKPQDAVESSVPDVRCEDIGGLHNEIDQIREMVELPMKHPEVFDRLGIDAPKGVLLSGPPGTGKTLLAKAVANETESSFFLINGPEIMSKFYGESEKQLREVFEKANKESPSIIFIDEIDSIAPKREEVTGEVERRVVSQMLTSMDGIKSRGQIVVIAATNRPNALDPALRRPGRFDREIVINIPDFNGRKEILTIHTRGMPLDEDVNLDKIAEMTYSYTGADLEVLCKEAALKALKPWMNDLKKYDEKLPANVLDKIKVKMQHFIDGFRKVQPSALREILIRKPNVKWKDIGGLLDVKQKLREAIEWPLKTPEDFKKAGVKPPKGVLLYGPPGNGKTLLAKAIANEVDANFISVKGPELISKWVGESEKQIREIFKKARQVSPTIIFFDEFDSISKIRGSTLTDSTERMVNQLLTELDGLEELENVIVIAATNRPDLIDPGLLRPGRIDYKIEIPRPDEESRHAILNVHTKNMPLDEDVNLKAIAKDTTKLSGAEIEGICKEAAMLALRDYKIDGKKLKITKKHFKDSITAQKESMIEKTTQADYLQ